MADPPAALPGETPTQTKARLRRERLAAKSGAQRLQQISSVQGGPPTDLSAFVRDLPVKSSSAPSRLAPTPRPADMDVSDHHHQQAADGAEDPVMAMLQQLMARGAGDMPPMSGPPAHHPAAPPGLPPHVANLFAAMQGGPAAEPAPEQSSACLWRLGHALFSLALAVYMALHTPFTGSQTARHAPHHHDWTAQPAPAHDFARFFYLFATFEVVMQSSRYLIEKGQLQAGGMLTTVVAILPPPWSNYLRTLGRYSVIWTTVVSDAMVVVFVLGAASWWKGAAAA
ncbi:hypothetical protein ACEQ8H_003060 [Pleosporales sp. CAS-2024a]